jgi:hypothetical protein
MATGEHARTLTPDTPLLSRKRSYTQTPTPELSLKRPREQGGSGRKKEGSLIIEAINRSIEARRSNTSRAIEILAEEYYNRLPEAAFDRVVDLLSDETKASIFISLGVRDIRDKWLERQAGVVFNISSDS